MATLASITPADGAVEVDANVPLLANITQGTDLDLGLIEIEVNGISHTQANGRLKFWDIATVSGGAVVDELQDIIVETLGPWYDHELHLVDVDVIYDGGSIGTSQFTTRKVEGFLRTADAFWSAWALSKPLSTAPGETRWYIVDPYRAASTTKAEWIVYEFVQRVQADAWWWVAYPYRDMQQGSGVVSQPQRQVQPASGSVHGILRQLQAASGIVQGDKVNRMVLSGIVGVEFLYRTASSGIVAIEQVKRIPASGVVYWINARNVIQVRILDDAAYQALLDDGITFG